MQSLTERQARNPEKPEPIISRNGDNDGPYLNQDRLAYAKIDGPSIILAYMADDKTHVSSMPPGFDIVPILRQPM